jgi:iron complex transport system substrate-binding protein
MRIVSLTPGAAEIVASLGLLRRLVGVGYGSDWPPEVLDRPVVTRPVVPLAGRRSRTVHRHEMERRAAGARLVALDAARLRDLRPDLILLGAPDDPWSPSRPTVEAAIADAPGEVTLMPLSSSSIEGVFHAISTVGAMAGAEAAAMRQVERSRGRLGRIERKVERRRTLGVLAPRVVAIDRLGPLDVAGRWVPEQIRRAGGWDVLGREGEASSRTTWREIRDVDPEVLLVMPARLHVHETVSEWERTPRPARWHAIQAVQRGRVFAVDGEAYFTRPGPRLVDGIAMLAEILDPDGFVDVAPVASWTPVE